MAHKKLLELAWRTAQQTRAKKMQPLKNYLKEVANGYVKLQGEEAQKQGENYTRLMQEMA